MTKRRYILFGGIVGLLLIMVVLGVRQNRQSPLRADQVPIDSPDHGQYQLTLTNSRSQPMAGIYVTLSPVLTSDDPPANPVDIIDATTNDKGVALADLNAGDYEVKIYSPADEALPIGDTPQYVTIQNGQRFIDQLDAIDYPADTSPTLAITKPSANENIKLGDRYTINFAVVDPDDAVTASFFYTKDKDNLDGTAIAGTCTEAAETTNSCVWDTKGVETGTYYIYGVVNDNIAPPVYVIANGTVSVNSVTPASTIEKPATGANEQVAQGSQYGLQYTVNDSYPNTNIELHYALAKQLNNDPKMNGSCGSAPKGQGLTCQWDTTGVLPAIYYVYGLVRQNGQGSGFLIWATGQVTVLPATPSYLSGASRKAKQIDLTWLDNATGESGFEIWRADVGSPNFTKIGTAPANTATDSQGRTKNNFSDSSVKSGKQYLYKVGAVKDQLISNLSGIITVKAK